MSATGTWAALVTRGCLCGTDDIARCPIHTGQSDNRGIRAYFQAGMPRAFPFDATCSLCRSAGLLYPNVEIDSKDGSGEFKPTLVCPRCSQAAAEHTLVREAEGFGYALGDRRVFGALAGAAA